MDALYIFGGAGGIEPPVNLIKSVTYYGLVTKL